MSGSTVKDNNWQQLLLAALIGVVLTGIGLVVRGDFLGSAAAAQVEERLEDKIGELKTDIGADIKEIKDAILRLEQKSR